jgi:hypothetical protein
MKQSAGFMAGIAWLIVWLTSGLSIALIIGLILAGSVLAQNATAPPQQDVQKDTQKKTQKEGLVTSHAAGPFDVKVIPADDKFDDPLLARMTIDKQYHGELEGTAKGQMLTAGSAAKGSGAYVAIEKVTGTLQGRTGTFVLQHSGTMTQGAPQLNITVVPDSGTGQLAGIAGKMNIKIAEGGKHFYDFEYTLPQTN